ncbi:hypothetical protein EK21DRAFT_87575 [Setomelanomma holmii]|uniref:Zn(2)-C6 fungal-type domain-containing protein n=1 Tax=Setomelanomma holmii TaxID=210430 RepID=A0A9P4HCC3_9PLEO|nr:hypothetical protein EK21DRAFT_87575 [Setomelanomma holmii]
MDSSPENPSESSRPLRILLPASSPREVTASPPKRHRISMACAACRSRKTKCDGDRPNCHECVSRDSECHYTETETALLKRKHEDLEELFSMFRNFPEQEANDLLARIRAGMEPSQLVEQVKHGSVLMQLSSSSSSGSRS